MAANLQICSGIAFTFLVLLLSSSSSGHADQIDFETYIRLLPGMSEAEILVRAGPPDREIFFRADRFRGDLSDKQMHYLPGPEEADPHLTLITIERGIVREIDRIKLFSPPREEKGGQIEFETFKRLRIGMSEAEVVALAGVPDKEGFISEEERQLLYIPKKETHDPHITIITTRRARVINIERIKSN